MANTLEELANIIANIGVIASCTEICSYLGNTLEVDICDALCSGVGITVFVLLVKEVEKDPDAIYVCKKLSACDSRVGNVRITQFTVSPVSSSQGTTFSAIGFYTVFNETGTGQICLYIQSPPGVVEDDVQPMGLITQYTCNLIEDLQPNKYNVTVPIASTDSVVIAQSWPSGQYVASLEVCEGTCGSSWDGTILYSQKSADFTITGT